MIAFCKYCQSKMTGEFETLGKNRYRFFFICPNCKSVYEGVKEDNNNNVVYNNARWFNPLTKTFEDP